MREAVCGRGPGSKDCESKGRCLHRGVGRGRAQEPKSPRDEGTKVTRRQRDKERKGERSRGTKGRGDKETKGQRTWMGAEDGGRS